MCVRICKGDIFLKKRVPLRKTRSLHFLLSQGFPLTDLHCQIQASQQPLASPVQHTPQATDFGGRSNCFAPRIFLENTAWLSTNVLWKFAPGCVLYILCGVCDFGAWDREGHGFRRTELNNKLTSENGLLSSWATSCLTGQQSTPWSKPHCQSLHDGWPGVLSMKTV